MESIKKHINEWGHEVYDEVEFTEDNWNTVYRGGIVEETMYSYKIHSCVYGTHFIPKVFVRNITTPTT